jgi:hypothetical protein
MNPGFQRDILKADSGPPTKQVDRPSSKERAAANPRQLNKPPLPAAQTKSIQARSMKLPIAYYHDEVVAKSARILRSLGCRVVTEIPIVTLDGVVTRADILMVTPAGQWNLIEVKTGVGPKYEDTQRLVYPMAMIGYHVFTTDPRIVQFGFEPGDPLPAMNFYLAYKKDRRSRLQWVNPGTMEYFEKMDCPHGT